MNSIIEHINKVCQDVRLQSCDPLSFKQLVAKTRISFKKYEFDIAVKTKKDKNLSSDEFYVNAYYDPTEDEQSETPVEVIIHHNFNNNEQFSKEHITEFLIEIFDAVVHEYKHQRQSSKRKYITYQYSDTSPYNLYLADPDELDAYAISIAIELCRSLGKFRALRYMSKFNSLGKLKFNGKYVSPCLASYFGQFNNIDHPVLKRLAKKVYVRLQKIDTDTIFV